MYQLTFIKTSIKNLDSKDMGHNKTMLSKDYIMVNMDYTLSFNSFKYSSLVIIYFSPIMGN